MAGGSRPTLRPWPVISIVYLSLLFLWQAALVFHLVAEVSTHSAFVGSVKQHFFDDFAKYYEFGDLSCSSEKGRIYDTQTEIDWFARLTGGTQDEKLNSAHYPPYYCLWTMPLTVLPIELSYVAWISLTLISCVAAVSLVAKDQRKESRLSRFCFWIAALGTVAVWQNILLGQMAFAVLALFALFYFAWRRGNDIAAGVILAITTVKPQYCLMLAAPAIASRQWRLLFAALLAEIVIVAGSVGVLGWDAVRSYPEIISQRETDAEVKFYGTRPKVMVSIRGPLSTVLPDPVALALTCAANVAGSIYAVSLWRKARSGGESAFPYAVAATIILALLLSPHSHLYDFLLMILPWALTIRPEFQKSLSGTSSFAHTSWLLTFLFYPLASWVIAMKFGNDALSRLHVPLLLGMLVLSLTMFRQSLQPGQSKSMDETDKESAPPQKMASQYFFHLPILTGVVSHISNHVRKLMFQTIMELAKPTADLKVLDVGVTHDSRVDSNFFEKLYPYPSKITAVGMEDASFLEQEYPGLKFIKTDGKELPFAAQSFDLVVSFAVIEHVGSRDNQRAFLKELCRVGKTVCITTPNRWYPVEFHTVLPLLHWLPPETFRAILRLLRLNFYASEDTLNLLDEKELLAIMPQGIKTKVIKYRLLGLVSNLMVYGHKS